MHTKKRIYWQSLFGNEMELEAKIEKLYTARIFFGIILLLLAGSAYADRNYVAFHVFLWPGIALSIIPPGAYEARSRSMIALLVKSHDEMARKVEELEKRISNFEQSPPTTGNAKSI